MKKAANRKPKHNVRRAKARSQIAHSRASATPFKSANSLTGSANTNSARQPGMLDRLAYASRRLTTPLEIGAKTTSDALAWIQRAPRACIRAIPVPAEDREMVALLLAPFFILALALAGNQSIQFAKHLRALIARPVAPVMLPSDNGAAHQIALRNDTDIVKKVHLTALQPQALAKRIGAPDRFATSRTAPDYTAPALGAPAELTKTQLPAGVAPSLSRDVQPVALRMLPHYPSHQAVAQAPVRLEASIATAELASATPQWQAASEYSQSQILGEIDPRQSDRLVAFDEERDMATQRVSLFERCTLPIADTKSTLTSSSIPASATSPIAPATWFTPSGMPSFGQRLAAAARRQLGEFVIYNDAYRSISYPRGDVAKLYGVCTDVVIRAYRDLGIDLQVAVQTARVGSGDRNIDHRRTETLRRFFQRSGESLPVTTFSEDYLPGDIVTYARPQNTGTASRSHIAMVSDVIAPSGRPMIVHNRGWGPQLEDALFVDRITGHYRYSGPTRATPVGDASAKLRKEAGTDLRTADKETRRAVPNSRRTASTGRTLR